MHLLVFLFFLVFSPGWTNSALHACPFELPTTTITVKEHELTVEWAVTPRERSCGLSNRPSLDKNSGMLFVYPSKRPLSFWMKDTKIPLSIAFLDARGRIINIETMVPGQTLIKYRSNGSARYALEVNQGWFQDRNIHPGDRVIMGNLDAGIDN